MHLFKSWKKSWDYHKPTEEEIQDFLLFWNDVYKVWRELYPDKLDMELLEHKAKVRK
ncbi:MAG: hypothetical protein U5J96_00240 [Ignavibacteriaceae bacterium]|nr:hypothetical protein [Ignavibacteriaceae bacterium]